MKDWESGMEFFESPAHHLGGLRECCKFPQLGPWQSPSHIEFWGIVLLSKRVEYSTIPVDYWIRPQDQYFRSPARASSSTSGGKPLTSPSPGKSNTGRPTRLCQARYEFAAAVLLSNLLIKIFHEMFCSLADWKQCLPHDTMHSADYAVARCPSVCTSHARPVFCRNG